jgi:hypothetical protein
MVLQVIEDGPAVHHRQLHVEDDRIGLVLVREREPGIATQRDDAFEAALTGDFELGPSDVGIVLDDQHDAVGVLDLVAVVAHVAR